MKKLLLILLCLPMASFGSFPVNENINNDMSSSKLYHYKQNSTVSPSHRAPVWQGVVSLSLVFLSMFIASNTGIPTLLFSVGAIIFGIIGLSKKFNFFDDRWLNGLSIAGIALGLLVFTTSLMYIGNW